MRIICIVLFLSCLSMSSAEDERVIVGPVTLQFMRDRVKGLNYKDAIKMISDNQMADLELGDVYLRPVSNHMYGTSGLLEVWGIYRIGPSTSFYILTDLISIPGDSGDLFLGGIVKFPPNGSFLEKRDPSNHYVLVKNGDKIFCSCDTDRSHVFYMKIVNGMVNCYSVNDKLFAVMKPDIKYSDADWEISPFTKVDGVDFVPQAKKLVTRILDIAWSDNLSRFRKDVALVYSGKDPYKF